MSKSDYMLGYEDGMKAAANLWECVCGHRNWVFIRTCTSCGDPFIDNIVTLPTVKEPVLPSQSGHLLLDELGRFARLYAADTEEGETPYTPPHAQACYVCGELGDRTKMVSLEQKSASWGAWAHPDCLTPVEPPVLSDNPDDMIDCYDDPDFVEPECKMCEALMDTYQNHRDLRHSEEPFQCPADRTTYHCILCPICKYRTRCKIYAAEPQSADEWDPPIRDRYDQCTCPHRHEQRDCPDILFDDGVPYCAIQPKHPRHSEEPFTGPRSDYEQKCYGLGYSAGVDEAQQIRRSFELEGNA